MHLEAAYLEAFWYVQLHNKIAYLRGQEGRRKGRLPHPPTVFFKFKKSDHLVQNLITVFQRDW